MDYKAAGFFELSSICLKDGSTVLVTIGEALAAGGSFSFAIGSGEGSFLSFVILVPKHAVSVILELSAFYMGDSSLVYCFYLLSSLSNAATTV